MTVVVSVAICDTVQAVRSRKALCTTMVIVVLFMLCWLPYCLFEALVYLLRAAVGLHFQNLHAHKILFLLMLFNSFLDPFVYAARMREIQRG